MTPTERVLAALRDGGTVPKRTGEGWACRCPSHDDRTPSLGVSAGDDGRALLICRAGCPTTDVVAAIGLTMRDLMPDNGSPAPTRRRRGDGDGSPTPDSADAQSVTVAGDTAPGCDSARDAVAELERTNGPRSAVWTYLDAAGQPEGLVIRWDRPEGKRIRPVSRCREGWGLVGMRSPRPLYGLPDLLAASPGSRVYVAEGEKAADALQALGLVATTSPHGSKSAGKADWSPTSGHEVVIVPDHDAAGEGYADQVMRLALAAGALSVRIVRLAELWADMPEGGDIVDLIEHHGGEVESVLADLERLTADAEPEEPPSPPPSIRFRSFPVEVLPEPVRSYVAEGARALACDPCYLALPLLAGLAAAIGNTHRIMLKRSWTEPAIVWAVIVAESGTVKSPAMELALRCVRTRQHRAMKEHADRMQAWESEHARWEIEYDAWRKAGLKGGATGDLPAEPAKPICPRTWTDDVTTEALVLRLQENPRGLLMACDELSGWFNFDRYAGGKGGGDAAKWLEVFGGRSLIVDRKTSGTVYVPRASVSIAGCIPPETLRRALGREHRDSGLAARILFAHPPRMPKRWTDDEVSERTEAAVAEVFERLYELEHGADDDGDPEPRLVRLSPKALEAWVRFVNEHGAEQADRVGDEAAAWAKLEGYAARLALVIHLTRVAAGDPSVSDPRLVDADSIASGVVMVRWFAHEAERVYSVLSGDDDARERGRLADWIAGKGGSVTVRELSRGPREYRDAEKAKAALDELVAAGHGRWEPTEGGRSVRFWLGGDADTPADLNFGP